MTQPTTKSQPVRRWLDRLVRRVACWCKGHTCHPTGRHAILLVEWRCERCGGLYVSHAHHGNALIAADEVSDFIFRDVMNVINASKVYPPNPK